MKKILSLILLLLTLFVGCFFPILGTFAMSNMDSSMHEGMNHDMPSHEWMHSVPQDNPENIHECCESPFIDAIIQSSNTSSSQPDTDNNNDSKVLYVLNETLFSNSINRLNSPPKPWEQYQITSKNTYTLLVGIIKNNS